AKGLISIYKDGETLKFKDQVSKEVEKEGLFRTVFKDGKLLIEEELSTIRQRLV
ncbi:MAG: nicotinate phosphoribosyltransferase, partial [Aquimarina sp.]|nr:nicotinate phosphoribosyltransferase [Aquimarina sp.]